jgi:hypothetical protein
MNTGLRERVHEPVFMVSGPGPDGPSRNDDPAAETIGFFASIFMAGAATCVPIAEPLCNLQEPLSLQAGRGRTAALIQPTPDFFTRSKIEP